SASTRLTGPWPRPPWPLLFSGSSRLASRLREAGKDLPTLTSLAGNQGVSLDGPPIRARPWLDRMVWFAGQEPACAREVFGRERALVSLIGEQLVVWR